MAPRRFDRLPTERANPASARLDRMTPLAVARLMNREDRRAVAAVGREASSIARAVDLIAEALERGGRLFFVGAGTSGRLGVLEAAECPPTFGTSPRTVQALMAGGRTSVFRSREGVEDDARAARRAIDARVNRGDVVVGISASGVTPFVAAALARATRRGARTILVSCNPAAGGPRRATGSPGRAERLGVWGPYRGPHYDIVIAPSPGPEVLTGSTRLKAGTATKLVLNTLTLASMARLGKVYGNRMIDVQPRSAKLRDRARRLVRDLGRVSTARAAALLTAAGGSVRVAIVMAHTGVSAAAAARALHDAGGVLGDVVQASGKVVHTRR